MKTLIIVFISSFICVFTSTSIAQLKPFSIGPYGEVGSPTGDFANSHTTGFGGGLTADFKLPVGFGITGSAGYMYFGGKTIGGQKIDNISAFPVRAGIKYYIAVAYIKLESGLANISNSDGSAVIISPGVGVRLMKFDIQAKYEVWARTDSWAFWGVKASFRF